MTSLINAIRERISDRELSRYEIDDLVNIMAADGVSAAEMAELLAAFDRTEHGFEVGHRAQLWVRLNTLGAHAALAALEARPAKPGPHRLAESQARIEFLIVALAEARDALRSTLHMHEHALDPEALARGELRPAQPEGAQLVTQLRSDLARAQNALVRATTRLQQALASLSGAEREAVLAGIDDWVRRRIAADPPDAKFLIGMADADRAVAGTRFADLPPEGVGSSFAGVAFAAATAWQSRDGRLALPTGTVVTSLAEAGGVVIEGSGVRLPNDLVLNGRARAVSGRVYLAPHAQATVAGIPVQAGSGEALIASSDGALTGGPGLRLALQPVAMPEDSSGVEQRTLRFAFTDSELPDGTELKSGRGELVVLVRNGEVLGMLADSLTLAPGAVLVVARRQDQEAPLLFGHGGTSALLKRGKAMVQDGRLVGLGANSEAVIDGVTWATGREGASYRFEAPDTVALGRGVTVTAVPADREIRLRGAELTLVLGNERITVTGSVTLHQGRVMAFGAESEVVMAGVRVTTGRFALPVVREPSLSSGLYVSAERIVAAGRDFTIEGQNHAWLPSSGMALAVGTGSMDVRRVREPGLVERIEVTATGTGRVTGGAYTLNVATGEASRTREGMAGPLVRVHSAGGVHEIDGRLLWPDGSGKLSGRVRRVPFVEHPQRFGGLLASATRAILSGRRTLRRGERGEMVKRIQESLRYFLGADLALDGSFGAATEAALKAFQRLSLLPQTGVVDAATLRRLDAMSPPDGAPASLKRRKVMVMVAVNSSVPDELRRFRQLAAERGAEAVIIGPPDSAHPQVTALGDYFAAAERGEIDFDWLVISGHSTGSSTWGTHGRLDYSLLAEWTQAFPAAAAQIEKLQLLNCYNVTLERANSYWPTLFPNITALAGFMYSAPGEKAQTSDEMLLNSGRLFARIGKGEVPDAQTARALGDAYRTDNYIKWQNASAWIRHRAGGADKGHFAMTAAALYETRLHGAGAELNVMAFEQARIFERYLAAGEAGFEEPPSERHTGPLRQYLNAVDTILTRWEQRLRTAEQYARRREADPTFEIPEEYRYSSNWSYEIERLRALRAQVLFLIYFAYMRRFFAEKYGAAVRAFNQLMEREGMAERFPSLQEFQRMNRQQVLALLSTLQNAVNRLPNGAADRIIDEPAWRIMAGTDPAVTAPTSARGLVERADAFLRQLDARFIAAEWL